MARILTDCEAIFFRDQLRTARAAALQDAEGFDQILFCLERLGLQLLGVVGALGGIAANWSDLRRSRR
jgi:hypothetical protein